MERERRVRTAAPCRAEKSSGVSLGDDSNFSKEVEIPNPKELFRRETVESLHGFVTVHWDHATSDSLESRL